MSKGSGTARSSRGPSTHIAHCSAAAGPDEPNRSRRIDAVDVHGTVATATMTLSHGSDTFTDIFLLVRVGDGWRIANKAYHRHP